MILPAICAACLGIGLWLDPKAFLASWAVLAALAAVLPAIGPARWRRPDPGSWYMAAHVLALPAAYAWTATH